MKIESAFCQLFFSLWQIVELTWNGTLELTGSLKQHVMSGLFPTHSLKQHEVSDVFPIDSLIQHEVSDVFPIDSLIQHEESGIFPIDSLKQHEESGIFSTVIHSLDNLLPLPFR